jgi:uncharacterized protein YjcR
MQRPITQRRASLSPAQREQLDADYVAGTPIKVIAETYGCDPSYPAHRARRAGRRRRLAGWGEAARLRRLKKLNQQARNARPIEGEAR